MDDIARRNGAGWPHQILDPEAQRLQSVRGLGGRLKAKLTRYSRSSRLTVLAKAFAGVDCGTSLYVTYKVAKGVLDARP